MDFKTQGDEIVRRKNEAMIGFQKTFKEGKTYGVEDMRIKNEWVVKIEQATEDFTQWLRSIPKTLNFSKFNV